MAQASVEEKIASGVVITQRLVLPGAGRASGTFSASGAVSGVGTVVTDGDLVLASGAMGEQTVIDVSERLIAPGGSLGISLRTVLGRSPGRPS